MKYIYYILFMAVFMGCHKNENSMFRWIPLLPEADSITLSLERELIKSTDHSSLRPLIEKMDSISENYPDIKQLSGRAYYWRAKMYHKLEMFDSMEYWSDRSRMLMDSAAYPYDYARLNLLFPDHISERTVDTYTGIVKVIEYARKTSDPLLEANALVASDILKTMLEIKSNDEDFNRVFELYSDLGLAMTEKDNVLQSVSDHVSRLEKEGTLSHGEARKLDADIKIHLNGRQEWEDFKELFSKVHPAFADEVVKRYPKITEGDVRLAIYIKAGLTTKQIARMLIVQPASVKMNRHRLRERMGLTSDQSLEDALRDINS